MLGFFGSMDMKGSSLTSPDRKCLAPMVEFEGLSRNVSPGMLIAGGALGL